MKILQSIQSLKTRYKILWSVLLIVVVSLIVINITSGSKKGRKYWFDDHTFHFDAMRTLAYAPFKAADVNEVLTAVSNITEGDLESWYSAWFKMAKIIEEKGLAYKDANDKASAFLRASNYYRAAEFFLHGDDPRRKVTSKKRIEYFKDGLKLMGIQRNDFKVPYAGKNLEASFYPAQEIPLDTSRPLVMIINGFDGMHQEMYYMLGQAATKRGYNVLIYDGPGQGTSTVDHGLTFTPEWHIPNSAVLDAFIGKYGKPDKIALVGISLGAWLGMEAISHDQRFDAYIANDVMYSFGETVRSPTPGIALWLFDNNYRSLFNFIINTAAKSDMMINWGTNHAKWVMGADDTFGAIAKAENFHFTDEILSKVTADILLLEGEGDHFMIETDQMGRTMRGLKNARSVERLTFKIGEGGEEHCHLGALLQAQAEQLSWIDSKLKN